MLIGIEGNVGSGKTILAVRYAKHDSDNGRKIFTNLNLKDIPYESFKIEEFLSNEYNESLKNATVILDEITVYMDCRLGSSKQNLLMGYLVLQSRKRGIDIYYTTQDLDLVDFKRLVKYTNMVVYAQEIFVEKEIEDKNGNFVTRTEPLEFWRHYTIIDLRKYRDNITEFDMDIRPYFNYYDTNQIIEPLVQMSKKNVKKKV